MKKTLVAFGIILGDVISAPAQDDVAAFYRGKMVRLVVGIGVGSGYDINARVLARHCRNTSQATRK